MVFSSCFVRLPRVCFRCVRLVRRREAANRCVFVWHARCRRQASVGRYVAIFCQDWFAMRSGRVATNAAATITSVARWVGAKSGRHPFVWCVVLGDCLFKPGSHLIGVVLSGVSILCWDVLFRSEHINVVR